MGTEIERKFLVDPDRLPEAEKRCEVVQGYLATSELTVRVRIQDESAFLTLKSNEPGIRRTEFEYPVPVADARELLEHFALPGRIEKERRYYRHCGHVWEVDVFSGENEGLILGEVEIDSPEEEVALPPWVTREVSGDKRYFNAYLARNPYREWSDRK